MKFPQSFPLCNRENCPQAAQCLRRLAWDGITPDVEWPILFIVNPLHTATDGHCPSFKLAQPVIMARGFRNMLSQMPHGKVGTVASLLSASHSQRTYYKMRNGERPLTPAEQEEVVAVLTKCGAPQPITFDESYEDYLWTSEK